jgi:asparagine synthetase B (glutamine-hydrolysing)
MRPGLSDRRRRRPRSRGAQHVEVVLTGEGADELLAGYEAAAS